MRGSSPGVPPPTSQLKSFLSGVEYSDEVFQCLKSSSGRGPSWAVRERRWSSSSCLGPGIQNSGCPVISSNTRHPKLQISRVLLTAPIRINSGARSPSGVTGLAGGSVKEYSVQNVSIDPRREIAVLSTIALKIRHQITKCFCEDGEVEQCNVTISFNPMVDILSTNMHTQSYGRALALVTVKEIALRCLSFLP